MLKKTALYDTHVRLGGKMVEFAGYSLPVQYSGILEEHKAVRTAAGLFDVSHMGEFLFRGVNAESALNALLTNDIRGMRDGQVRTKGAERSTTCLCTARTGSVSGWS